MLFGLALLSLAITPARVAAQSLTKPLAVHVWQDTMEMPTYEEGPPDENPPFDQFVTNGRYKYPYTMRENLTNRVAPHLYRCIDKRNGADLFYTNPSLKFARIAYRGVWAAYGIEFNFPVSHNWMTASPVDFSASTVPDGSGSVWVRNIDRVYGMEWRVE